MKGLEVATERGTVLNGVIFDAENADTVVIAITGIHGNFYSNPFYFNIGDTLSANGIDFVYAQTNDAFGKIETYNAKTGAKEIIGSWNERFSYTDDDIGAYLDFAEKNNYKHIILAGHSLGANKVIHYLSGHHDEKKPEHFIFLSPASLTHMMENVTASEKEIIRRMVNYKQGEKILPFYFMGWVQCTANTAYDWISGALNNVHTEVDGDFNQIEKITHNGAMVIGTYDKFTRGNPAKFLENINDHMKTSSENKLVFIEKTGHTYQQKEQEIADIILKIVEGWRQ